MTGLAVTCLYILAECEIKMDSDIKSSKKCVGIKQSTEAVTEGKAQYAIVAEDTDSHVKEPFLELCNQKNVPVKFYATKQELGKACGIDVGAAVTVILK